MRGLESVMTVNLPHWQLTVRRFNVTPSHNERAVTLSFMAMELIIYGAGGFAREVAWLAESCGSSGDGFAVRAFVDDDSTLHGSVVNGIPVMGLDEAKQRHPVAPIVSGIGIPKVREIVMQKAARAGFKFASLVHDGTLKSQWVTIGEGAVICAGNIFTTNITIGSHVQVNLACTIGHDVVIGDYSSLAPGVNVSGWVHIGQRVYLGTGCSIINGTQHKPLIIEDDAVVGAGACVAKPVSKGATVVGIPARPIQR